MFRRRQPTPHAHLPVLDESFGEVDAEDAGFLGEREVVRGVRSPVASEGRHISPRIKQRFGDRHRGAVRVSGGDDVSHDVGAVGSHVMVLPGVVPQIEQ